MQIILGTGLDAGRPRSGGGGGPGGDPSGGGGPRPLRAPRLTGAGRIGETLALDPGDWRGAERLAFAWLKDGTPIPGAADALAYVPVAADDHAVLAAEVTAHGAGARASLRTAPVTIAFAPPVAVAPEREFAYTQISGTVTLDISSFFSGSSLSFGVVGEGLTVDPQTGFVTFDSAALRAGVTLRLIARNSGGEARIDFTLVHQPEVVALPVATVAPRLTGTGRVGEPLVADPGSWTGEPAIALQWLKDGAAIAGATGVEFVPGDAEDGAQVSCRATASNAAGATVAETAAVAVVQAPPALVGVLADQTLAAGAGAARIPAAAAFSGRGLRFAVTGAGATIDAATGAVSIPTATARAAETVAVSATNSGGSIEARFAVRILAAPRALAAPAALALAQATGTRAVEAAGWFSGEALAFTLESGPAGATIDAATGRVTLPLSAAWSGDVTVRAANVAGSAVQKAAARILAAPAALAAPGPVTFLQGSGTATVSAQAFFSGSDLVFTLEGAPSGATIQASSGLVSLATDAALAAELTIRAANAAGSAVQKLSVTVAATVSDFSAAAEVGRLPFLYVSEAPSWTAVTGFGRLRSAAADRAHGDWPLARGDGRYRALARWSMNGQPMTQARPFGLIGRLSKTGSNFLGVQVYALLSSNDARQIQIRAYTGSGIGSTILATAASAWAWDVWNWIEVEFEGSRIRGRIYAETAAQPTTWQASAVTTHLGAGGFGPMAQGMNGLAPTADVRRLEYQPLASVVAAAAPAAARDADWSLGQATVKE